MPTKEPPKGKSRKTNRPSQNGYEIVIESEGYKVNQVWVRLGTLDAKGNHRWDRTMAIGPIVLDPGQTKTVAMVDEDQLPVSASNCSYQVLCEIDNEHGDPEILMTDPASLS